MKPPRFKYYDPATLDEALDFLADHGPETKVLAGGQSLMPVLNMRLVRPAYLLDLNRISSLDYVRRENGSLRLGAMTRHDTVMQSAEVEAGCALVSRSMPWIGHTAIRYRGTVGGSLVHADPAAELPAVMVALDAELTVAGKRGRRTVPASEFFLTYFSTAVEPTELLVDVRVPVLPSGSGSSVLEIARRHGDFALAGIAATVELDGSRISSCRLAAFGVDDTPTRLDGAEAILRGAEPDDEVLRQAGEAAASAVEPDGDIHATAEYRRQMTSVLVRRATAAAVADAGRS